MSWNRTSSELPRSIKTHLISQLLYSIMMTHAVVFMRDDPDGVSTRENDASPWSSLFNFDESWGITFVVRTFMTYLLQEELEFPPLIKPSTMLLMTNSGSFLAISKEVGENDNDDGRCDLALPGSHGGSHCTYKKVHYV